MKQFCCILEVFILNEFQELCMQFIHYISISGLDLEFRIEYAKLSSQIQVDKGKKEFFIPKSALITSQRIYRDKALYKS